ncbi:hypothetical protein GQG92_004879 [Salmonella enterica]|nr:hypothetical protein [Salmonella enterica]
MSEKRTDTLPAGFVRFEHTLAEMPLMLYGVSLDIENYCTLRRFFVPLSYGKA